MFFYVAFAWLVPHTVSSRFTLRLLRQVALTGTFQAQLHWNQAYIAEQSLKRAS